MPGPRNPSRVLSLALSLICLAATSAVAQVEITETCVPVIAAPGTATASTSYRAEVRAPLSRNLVPAATLRIDVIAETVAVGVPFPVVIRAYDHRGLPFGSFSEPVTFECALGVVPILSSARWLNGVLFETIVIPRSGRNARLSVVTQSAVISIHLDILPPPADKAMWLEVAEDNLARGRFDNAIFAFKNASSFHSLGDPAIERRIAKLYMQRGRWMEAEAHYRRAIRAAAAEPTLR